MAYLTKPTKLMKEPNGMLDATKILRTEGYKGPSTRVDPNFLLRVVALFDREAKGMRVYLGMDVSFDNSETRKMFDWTPIPSKQFVL